MRKGFWVFMPMLMVMVACGQGRTERGFSEVDSLPDADTLAEDTSFFFDDEDDGLTLGEREVEAFSDFIYAFTHNGRFQAERIRFPLPVRDIDGSETRITSGKRFRSEFLIPNNDYYTLILGDMNQMDDYQNDSSLTDVAFQFLSLADLRVDSYNFKRTDGRWFLENRSKSHVDAQLIDFMHFYHRFITDSIFQQESLSRNLSLAIEESEDSEEEISGTIDPDQWPAFRPEMPSGEFVNIDFGQSYPNPGRIHLLKCGISNGMLDIFTFQRDGEQWKLISYEN